MPPATTPRIATTMMTMNSGNVTPTDGSLELNGSNDTVTIRRLATAKIRKMMAIGMTTSAVKNLRINSPALAATDQLAHDPPKHALEPDPTSGLALR